MVAFYFILLIIVVIASFLGSSKITSLIPNMYTGRGWGNYYKKQLNLKKQEKRWLNQFSHIIDADPLSQIDFCRDNLVILFLTIYRSAPIVPNESELYDLLNYSSFKLKKEYEVFIPTSEIRLNEITRIENSIEPTIKEQFNIAFSNQPRLTIHQEKILNSTDKIRWNTILEKTKTDKSYRERYYEYIKGLELNESSIITKRNLYYDSHLFMVDKDRTLAIKFYLHYLDVGSESKTFKFKNITKQNLKVLFENETQLKDFQSIVEEFKKKKNLEKAFLQLEELYVKKRKKVVLDEKEISSAKNDLRGVVDLLNDYLEDEQVIEEKTTPIMEKNTSTASTNVELNAVQLDFLKIFVAESYSLSFEKVEEFANTKGVFKSQLIDSINEQCYDTLDDMLIEDTEDGYEMNKKYYEKITA